MRDLFVDTSGWGCWLDKSLSEHDDAKRLIDEATAQGGRLITTSFVLIELVSLLTSPLKFPKSEQVQLVEAIENDPTVVVIRVEQAVETEAWQLWRSRIDKAWSIVDCSSFVIMEQRKLTDALTTDQHFAQAGFRKLL